MPFQRAFILLFDVRALFFPTLVSIDRFKRRSGHLHATRLYSDRRSHHGEEMVQMRNGNADRVGTD